MQDVIINIHMRPSIDFSGCFSSSCSWGIFPCAVNSSISARLLSLIIISDSIPQRKLSSWWLTMMRRMASFWRSLVDQNRSVYGLYRHTPLRGRVLYASEEPLLLHSQQIAYQPTHQRLHSYLEISIVLYVDAIWRSSRKSHGQPPPVRNTTCSNDHNIFTRQRALGTLAEIDDSWDEDWERRVACMSTTFTALCADDVDACEFEYDEL